MKTLYTLIVSIFFIGCTPSDVVSVAKVGIVSFAAERTFSNVVNKREERLGRINEAVYNEKPGSNLVLISNQIAYILATFIVVGIICGSIVIGFRYFLLIKYRKK